MKKLWDTVTAVATVFGLIDVLTNWIIKMEFLRAYIFTIIGILGVIGFIVNNVYYYLKGKREKEAIEKAEIQQKEAITTRFIQFKAQYDGLFDGFGNPMTTTMLPRHFNDHEINWLVKNNYVKLKIAYVF